MLVYANTFPERYDVLLRTNIVGTSWVMIHKDLRKTTPRAQISQTLKHRASSLHRAARYAQRCQVSEVPNLGMLRSLVGSETPSCMCRSHCGSGFPCRYHCCLNHVPHLIFPVQNINQFGGFGSCFPEPIFLVFAEVSHPPSSRSLA